MGAKMSVLERVSWLAAVPAVKGGEEWRVGCAGLPNGDRVPTGDAGWLHPGTVISDSDCDSSAGWENATD